MKSLTVLFVVLYAAVCFGADAAPVAWGDTLSTFLNNTIFPILGALLTGFVSWACMKIGTKFKISALTEKNNFVTQLAAQGVAFAEEKGANYAKSLAPISSNDKLNAAIAYVMQMAPTVTTEQAQSLVTSALAMLPNAGATGTATVTAAPVVVAPAVVTPDPLAVAP